jgi:hypothetical protein
MFYRDGFVPRMEVPMSNRSKSLAEGGVLLITFLVLLATVFSLPAIAQVAGGTILGTVTDPGGAVIPGAKISVKNLRTNEVVSSSANRTGLYSVPNLVPGNYDVTASVPGFDKETVTNITLTVGAQQLVNFKLKVGTATEIVDVSAVGSAVESTTSTISGIVGEQTVRELPLNGRSWTDLAALQPGVDAIQTQPSFATGPDRGNRGFGQQMTISGARPQQNNYRLDGVSLNDYANGAPGSVLGGNLGVDAIQEFSVLTSNYSAEYGKTSGGVVNAVTRSGTNQFHGSIYEFLRNSALDARNFFDLGKIPPFKRNQFGGGVGGPIIKDRTFFFADYEGIRQSKGISNQDFVPSDDARKGILHNSDGTITNVMVDSSASKYLTFYGPPNGGLTADPNVAIFNFAGQQVVNENFVTARVDHKISDKDSLFGTYLFDRTPYSSPDGMNDVRLGNLSQRQIAVLEENHIISSGFVNTVRLGYNRESVNNDVSLSAINPDAGKLEFGANPGRAAASVFVGGLTPFTGGVGSNPTYFYRWNSYQAYDDAFMTRGTHAIKFGVAFERMLLKETSAVDVNGIFRFPTLLDFLTNGTLTSYNTGIISSVTPRHLSQNLFGAYVQDDWHMRPNLTLNLGMRYEISSVPKESNGKLANLRSLTDTTAHLGDPFFNNPTLKDFEPRVGFAWDPFRDGKTAVRGGIGLFDVQPLLYQFLLLVNQTAPFFTYSSLKPCSTGQVPPGCIPSTGLFFTGMQPLLSANTLRATYIEPNPKRDYVMQWNLNIQRELAKNLTAMVAYVGSRGVHQPFRVDDANDVLPSKTTAGYVWPFNPDGSPLNPLNPNFGSIRGMFYRGHSYYDALEAQVLKRMSHGLQIQGVYTWGKAIDTSSATVAGDAFGNSISSLHWFDLRLSRALADFNVTRNFTVNTTWDAPSPKSGPSTVKWLAGGWEVGAIYTAHDGVPFTPTFGTDGDPQGINNSDPWAFPNRLTGPGCGTAVHPGNPTNYINLNCFAVPTAPNPGFYSQFCNPTVGDPSLLQCFNLRGNAGRNSLIGPGTSNLDFSLFKNNYIKSVSEVFNIQFRAEVFNILNHANFAPPATPTNTDIFDSTGSLLTSTAGQLTSTTTTAREIQFAIKVTF